MNVTPLQRIALVCGLLVAGATQAEMVVGHDNFACVSTATYSFDSVDDACSDLNIKAYQLESENFDTCHICDVDTSPTGPGIVLRPCPSGQHGHGLNCHANHVCGSNQIGGGAKDCETCPDGHKPNAAGTACVSLYRVARCTRPLDALPQWIGRYLPYHVNVVSEKTDRLERGFFAVDMVAAVQNAGIYLGSLGLQVVFTPGRVEQDANLGTCVYESNVSKQRYETVRTRMGTYNWNRYHLIAEQTGQNGYGTCITWANSVLH